MGRHEVAAARQCHGGLGHFAGCVEREESRRGLCRRCANPCQQRHVSAGRACARVGSHRNVHRDRLTVREGPQGIRSQSSGRGVEGDRVPGRDQVADVHRAQTSCLVVARGRLVLRAHLSGNNVISNRHVVKDAGRCRRRGGVGAVALQGIVGLRSGETIQNVVRQALPSSHLLINQSHDASERGRGGRSATDEINELVCGTGIA